MAIDIAAPHWRARRDLVALGAPVPLVARASRLTLATLERLVAEHGWRTAPDGLAARLRARLETLVSERLAAVDGEDAGAALADLARSADATRRIAAVMSEGMDVQTRPHRSDDDVRASLRRKLQMFAGRARREG